MALHGAWGMGHAVTFCNMAYLMSGCQLHSQNHCENDCIVIVIGNVQDACLLTSSYRIKKCLYRKMNNNIYFV